MLHVKCSIAKISSVFDNQNTFHMKNSRKKMCWERFHNNMGNKKKIILYNTTNLYKLILNIHKMICY